MSQLYARKHTGSRHCEPIWDDRKHSTATWQICGQLSINRRRTSILFLIAVLATIAFVFRWLEFTPGETDISSPPSWKKLQQWERDLPQHNLELPYPEGKNGRYVKFDNQIRMLGWNNVFNEVYASPSLPPFNADLNQRLMNTHLAYQSKRAYVFIPYVWKNAYYPWPESKFRENPPVTPLNALISGPSAGGPWEAGDPAPRSISETWFDVVCPPSERRIIVSSDIKKAVKDADGIVIFNHWRDLLRDAPERCIEVVSPPPSVDSFPQTFDLWLWGSERILSLWPTFSQSPVSRLLEPSPIVKAAIERNEYYLFLPRGPTGSGSGGSISPYERMLAIHVRRGDFADACVERAKWNSTFYSWNLLPELPDPFVRPPGGGDGTTTPEHTEGYMTRCQPPFEAIVRKVKEAREEYAERSKKSKTTLDTLFVMTNEQPGEWLNTLKATLRAEGWHTIVTSRELTLDREQMEVGMVVDMEIARRAAVFIGNGVCFFFFGLYDSDADGRG